MIIIKIKGLEALKNKFGMLPRDLENELSRAVRISAGWIARKTKPITPFDTGTLRKMTRMWMRRKLWALVAARTEYAVYVHEGTRRWPLHMPPKKAGTVRQFLRKGTELALPEIEKAFGKAVENALKE